MCHFDFRRFEVVVTWIQVCWMWYLKSLLYLLYLFHFSKKISTIRAVWWLVFTGSCTQIKFGINEVLRGRRETSGLKHLHLQRTYVCIPVSACIAQLPMTPVPGRLMNSSCLWTLHSHNTYIHNTYTHMYTQSHSHRSTHIYTQTHSHTLIHSHRYTHTHIGQSFLREKQLLPA